MAEYDGVVIGAGLGGLTAAAILARAGARVLVIERSNSVGGAASSYKVGDLFVEGSLHETGDPHDPSDPKHDPLGRAGVRAGVAFVAADAFYEVRGGPLKAPLRVPDDFDGAQAALMARFPEAGDALVKFFAALRRPSRDDAPVSLSAKLTALFGDREDIKCALAANLAYYHDDADTLAWSHFAAAQAHYLASGARYVQGGSQRLSSALARAVKKAGGEVLVRRVVTSIGLDAQGRAASVTHTAKDGSDPRTVEGKRIVSNAAPKALALLVPPRTGETLNAHYAAFAPSISLFALTLGLSAPPREFGVGAYSTQLWPRWMTTLADFKRASRVMANEPGQGFDSEMPPLSIADYSAIDAGVPAPPHVLSIFGPDHLDNWDASDMDAYRARRGRWQDAIVRELDAQFPGLANAIVASSFNSALSVRQYLDAPDGAVYGFAPTLANAQAGTPSPRTPVAGLYLASAYAGTGGYSGVIAAGAACADMILGET